ncbi:MAG: response regulator [Myxococcales bacterium]|nr:response regulator [Myxococcales bacterium]
MSRHYLVVDDNEAFSENLAEILRDTGATVEVAHDGVKALEFVRSQHFDALVTDMRMPGMNGAELLCALRKIDPGVPAVLLSAFSEEGLIHIARRDGLLAVLSKPQQIPRLLQVLESARRDGAVLLVEDDVALADNLTEALAQRGLTAVTAASVKELGGISARPFAVLVDLKLPDAGFGEALQRVHERWPGIPTIVMTAFGGADLLTTEECFHKPFDTASLLGRIEALYREHQRQ